MATLELKTLRCIRKNDVTGKDEPRIKVDELRQAFRPPRVRMLFVGESPPVGGTFFYRGDSNLATCTCAAFARTYGELEAVDQFLTAFRERGCYLVDLCQTPINGHDRRQRRAARCAGVEPLATVLSEFRPDRIVVVMKAIEREVRRAAAIAGLANLPLDVLPFPAQGHQQRYVEGLARLLSSI